MRLPSFVIALWIVVGCILLTPGVGRAEGTPTPTSLPPQVAFPSPEVRAWQVGLLRSDRLVHAGFSMTLVTALALAGRDTRTAAAVTLAAGLGKELWDRHPGGSGFDPLDLTADATGTLLGVVLAEMKPR